MSLVSKKKIKRIIVREGLIIMGLSIILYFLVSLFLQNVPVVLPRYRLESVNGETRTTNIFPEIRNDSNHKRLVEEAYNPSSQLIEKRIKEFIKVGNVESVLKSSNNLNSKQIYISRLYSRILGLTFVLKLFIIYIILLFAFYYLGPKHVDKIIFTTLGKSVVALNTIIGDLKML